MKHTSNGPQKSWLFCHVSAEGVHVFPLGPEATLGTSIADQIRLPRSTGVPPTALVRVVATAGRWICRSKGFERTVTEGFPFALGNGRAGIVDLRCFEAALEAVGGPETPSRATVRTSRSHAAVSLGAPLRFALCLARARFVASPVVLLAPRWQRRDLLEALVPFGAHASWIAGGAARALVAAATASSERRVVIPAVDALTKAQRDAVLRLLRRAHEHTGRFLFGAERLTELEAVGVHPWNCVVLEVPFPEILRDSFREAKAKVLEDLSRRYLEAISDRPSVAAGSAVAGLHRSTYYRIAHRIALDTTDLRQRRRGRR